jgi:hypothetical protein
MWQHWSSPSHASTVASLRQRTSLNTSSSSPQLAGTGKWITCRGRSILLYFPETDEDLARKSYALHINTIIRLVEELSLDLARRYEGAAFTERESETLNLAVELMISEGMVEPVETVPSEA